MYLLQNPLKVETTLCVYKKPCLTSLEVSEFMVSSVKAMVAIIMVAILAGKYKPWFLSRDVGIQMLCESQTHPSCQKQQ